VPRQLEQAREALGGRLREIRHDAGLSGRELAAQAGWHFTKVSKLENGRQHPSDTDIRDWCRHCHAPEEASGLIATAHSVESMYIEWRRQMKFGLKRPQQARTPGYERTRLFRIYEPGLIPGLFQTAEYATALMTGVIEFHDIPDDLDQAVAARLERQRLLYSGDRRFHVVLEQQALRSRVGTPETMAGQLDRLLALMGIGRVTLGIIPATAGRHTTPAAGFWIFDDETVQLETVSAELTITQHREVALYAGKFDLLAKSAVTGPAARNLIIAAQSDIPADSS
jgi:transcriptional regulator with XRE-family HTH domain